MTEQNISSAAENTAPQDENKLIAERREKLKALREEFARKAAQQPKH